VELRGDIRDFVIIFLIFGKGIKTVKQLWT